MEIISVLVPVFNGGKTIERCIGSIQKQKMPNDLTELEIVVVDDGSTDNTLELINAMAVDDNRIKVFSQENKGIACRRDIKIQTKNA